MPSIGYAMALTRARLVQEFVDTLPAEDREVAIKIHNLASDPVVVGAWAFGLFFAVALPMGIWGNRFGISETAWFWVSVATAATVCWVALYPLHRHLKAKALAFMAQHPALTARVREVMESV